MAYKILLVDDDKEIMQILEQRLTKEGYEVVVAFDGEEALEKAAKDNPDIIILDLMIPKLNGFEVLKEVREKYNKKWKPVIIVSADIELSSLKKSYDLEADHYLTKPVTIERLLQGIETMISLIPLRKQE